MSSAKDILFIFPPLTVDERYGRNVGKVGGNLPPLGIAALAAFIREKGFCVAAIDAVAHDLTFEMIMKAIERECPRAIGISSTTPHFHRAVTLAEMIRDRFPEKLLLIGGHHATIMPMQVMKEYKCFDILVFGEGELTVLDILERFKNTEFNKRKFLERDVLQNIKGIVFRDGQEVIVNGQRDVIHDLDILPYPALDLYPRDKYLPLPNQYKRKPVIHMVNIRGCPFNCSFCSNRAIFGKNIRKRSPKKVLEEIMYNMKTYRAKEISFWDDTMTADKKWIHEFCDRLIENKLDITWTGLGRVGTVNLELLKKMKKAGCWNLFYGFESGNQDLLDNIKKGITLQQIRDTVKWTKEAGIEIRASFMLALPGETPEKAQKTIDFAIELDPDYVQFSVTTPYPGTHLWDNIRKYGTVEADFSKYHGWEAVFVPYGYKDRETITKIAKKASRDFYLRPKYILNRLKKIRTREDVIRHLKGLRFLLGFSKEKYNNERLVSD